MATVAHDVFGTIEFDPGSELNEWSSTTEWAGGEVELDLSFDGPAPDRAALDGLARYVTDLSAFDRTARAAVQADVAEEESEARLYVEHHLDEPDIVHEVFGVADAAAVSTEDFLAALRLVRVGLYAGTEAEECQAVFDYTIARDMTQYLVVVKFDEDAAVCDVCMES